LLPCVNIDERRWVVPRKRREQRRDQAGPRQALVVRLLVPERNHPGDERHERAWSRDRRRPSR
jgi:hypothetical protein